VDRPPKGGARRKVAPSDGTSTPHIPVSTLAPNFPRNTHSCASGKTLSEQLSYLHSPRPFKNPNYTKNVNRRAKNLKAVLTQERERERVERERRRAEKEVTKMDVDGDGDGSMKQDVDEEEEIPTCLCWTTSTI
jgi:INO80 complex subunit C